MYYTADSSDGAHRTAVAQAAPGYESVTIHYTCEIEITWEYIPAYGEYVAIDIDVNWCITWRIYHNSDFPGGGWGSSGGSGGSNPSEPETQPPPPEPTDSLAQEKLNAKETALCLLNPSECGIYMAAANEAIAWANSEAVANNAWPAHNNMYDAYRHAYWSALLTKRMGSAARAQTWTDAHEWNSRNVYETCMDQDNNNAGRYIFSQLPSNSTDNDIKTAIKAFTNFTESPIC